MPEFSQNPYGLQDFHEAQLRHYFKKDTVIPSSGIAASPPSQPILPRNEANGMPVPTGTPMRKPVPGSSRSPAPRAQSPSTSPRTQNGEGTRLIFTRADGRFDPSTIRTEATSNSSKNSWRSRRDSAEQAVRRFSLSLKEKADIVGMDRGAREMYIRKKYITTEGPEQPEKSKPGRSGSITRGEKIALNISKAVDPIKARGRRGTDESSMSIGMTDVAPEGEMQACIRCYRPIFDFATKGLCQQCHKETRTLANDPRQFPQGRHTYPESPEHGYMKLPSRKILRIRQTIYEDPGNPFADDVEPSRMEPENNASDHKPLPTLPVHQELFDQANEGFGEKQREGEAPGWRKQLPRKLVACPPTGQAALSVNKHRSQSVALPAPSSWDKIEEEYVAPRTLWRKESAPLSDRNTKFYGFYDDIIRDYRARESRKLG